jgi:hypothetical protein
MTAMQVFDVPIHGCGHGMWFDATELTRCCGGRGPMAGDSTAA